MSDTLKNEMASPDDLARREAGKQGKLWSIEVIARIGITGTETKRWFRANLYENELMKAREKMFTHGILVPVDPGRWKIILPLDILEVEVTRQKNFFANEPFR